ncbi:restriction endonuclease subunit S [bacterium]|nr:restriction endonuclease subunit S [bacterium]
MKFIDKIPDSWELRTLKSLTTKEIQNGYSPNCPDKPTGNWILSLANLTETGFNITGVKPAPLNDTKINEFLLEPGDFLISRSNTIDKVGRVILFQGEIPNCSYPDLLMRFRVNDEDVTRKYLENYLKGIVARKYIQSCASGTSVSMVKINKRTVEKIPVLLPPLPEQKAIAELLSTWDEAIEKTERLIEAKEKRFKWLVDYLIIDKCKNQKWGKIKLHEIVKVVKGQQLNRSDLLDNGKYYALNGGVEPSGYTNNWNTLENTITISEGGNSCGYVNFNREKFWSGGHCYSLLNLKSDLNNEFLFYYLKSQERKIMNLRVGSGLPNIQRKDIENLIVMKPRIEEQKQIAEILNIAIIEIDILKQMMKKYKEQKRGLMQKLLTGQWRVKCDDVP